MDSSSVEGLEFDQSNSSNLSIEGKQELVYELSKWSNGGSEILQSWTRQEILEVLCAEMGKERKYTGLTKSKLIENLVRIVNEKKSQRSEAIELKPDITTQRTYKRQRKTDHSNHLPVKTESNIIEVDLVNIIYCKNIACKAKLSKGDAFCKRCSCCICLQYDDNKDPGLWLVCNSDHPFEGESCGMSCHLECAFKHETSGIGKEIIDPRLDGAFFCVSCGKVNDLLGCWKKQVIIAGETRRVDILCYRLALSQKILGKSKHYEKLQDIVDEAIKKLEEDVGPLTGLPVKKARGIVNRLSSGSEVQRLCALALETLDSMMNTGSETAPQGPVGTNNYSSLSNPSSVEDETNNGSGSNPLTCTTTEEEENRVVVSANESQSTGKVETVPEAEEEEEEEEIDTINSVETSTDNGSNTPTPTGLECVPFVGNLPVTPCKLEKIKDSGAQKNGRPSKDEEPQAGSSSKKRKSLDKGIEECAGNGDKDFEYYVKVIRWLECEGHIEKVFRQKFLTWYSLKATPQEVRIVKVFVDTFIEDPESLAGQLIHTFDEMTAIKKSCVVRGFCSKLWH